MRRMSSGATTPSRRLATNTAARGSAGGGRSVAACRESSRRSAARASSAVSPALASASHLGWRPMSPSVKTVAGVLEGAMGTAASGKGRLAATSAVICPPML
jgi:hypothetical protein